jgi:hypothetical protein
MRVLIDLIRIQIFDIFRMLYSTTLAVVFCMLAVSIHGLEQCPGASSESQEEFKWKYDAAPIVVYGTVSNVQKNVATLTVSCTLKGQFTVSTVELTQLRSYIS